MKLCCGKRRGSRSLAVELNLGGGPGVACWISDDHALPCGSSLGRTFRCVHDRNCWGSNLRPGKKLWFGFGRLQLPVTRLRPRQVGKRARIARGFLPRLSSPCRVGRRPLRPVLKHGPRSLTCVQAVGLAKPEGAVKAKGGLSPRGTILYGRSPATSDRPCIVGSRKSTDVGTRKMVNYAWPG